jgi:hypothetical protein
MHMTVEQKSLFLRYCPRILKDKADPFPVRYIGCTAFTAPGRSASFPKWFVDPKREGAAMILEYAIYYDYDIQHLYDLEHIWVAVDAGGRVVDCWCSFHGMRLRAAGMSGFTLDGDHPVLYSQPGKHAMLPHPELFRLHPDFEKACGELAGGGVLIPDFLSGGIQTDSQTDEKVARYIRKNFSFAPTMEFVPEQTQEDQLLSWEELLDKIPTLMDRQLKLILR